MKKKYTKEETKSQYRVRKQLELWNIEVILDYAWKYWGEGCTDFEPDCGQCRLSQLRGLLQSHYDALKQI